MRSPNPPPFIHPPLDTLSSSPLTTLEAAHLGCLVGRPADLVSFSLRSVNDQPSARLGSGGTAATDRRTATSTTTTNIAAHASAADLLLGVVPSHLAGASLSHPSLLATSNRSFGIVDDGPACLRPFPWGAAALAVAAQATPAWPRHATPVPPVRSHTHAHRRIILTGARKWRQRTRHNDGDDDVRFSTLKKYY
ncbi:hypothetical protein PCL_04183 [Purpureocillium lilacinum]|uniref:Uncharacterized protein n=1 Tax=Purpureocillium lilacinum TaxID=33203 RepID=A0A2U3ER71_PURLI|nr:hypothetical protein PCL_04183 [Purpureocillium lilacinum]